MRTTQSIQRYHTYTYPRLTANYLITQCTIVSLVFLAATVYGYLTDTQKGPRVIASTSAYFSNMMPSDKYDQYFLTICADLPVNDKIRSRFNWRTGFPGHSYLRLQKITRNDTVTAAFGLYPEIGWAVLIHPRHAKAKIMNNIDQPFDAALTRRITAAQAAAMMSEIVMSTDSIEYHLYRNNCRDFAVRIFNKFMKRPIIVAHQAGITTNDSMRTPNTLYSAIKQYCNSMSCKTQGTCKVQPLLK